MAQETVPEGAVRIQCVCGEEIALMPQVLGRIITCRQCGRHLRPALQFVLADSSLAPNVTAQCTCGHFIVEARAKAGKRARCGVCKSHFIMPSPTLKHGVERVVRVPRKVLEGRLRKDATIHQRAPQDMSRLQSAAHAGRISLGPGEHICVNQSCGALLGVRANVCPKCGTNRITGETYDGAGPGADPMGEWDGT